MAGHSEHREEEQAVPESKHANRTPGASGAFRKPALMATTAKAIKSATI